MVQFLGIPLVSLREWISSTSSTRQICTSAVALEFAARPVVFSFDHNCLFGTCRLWLQYSGFRDIEAAIIMGVFVAGEAVGNYLGGFVADSVRSFACCYARVQLYAWC